MELVANHMILTGANSTAILKVYFEAFVPTVKRYVEGK